MTVTKDLLLKPRLPEADVDLPGVGSVRVRGLSRAEGIEVQKLIDKGWDRMERKLLSLAMVDPPLTEAEVGEWQQASVGGEIEPVTQHVMELSGLMQGADKEAYKEFDADPAAEFRALPGGEAVDDGGPAPGGDVPG